MPWRELEREVGPHETGPADRLARLMTGLPHAQVRGLFDQGCVRLNGEPCAAHATPLAAGDRLAIRYEAGRRYREKPRVHEQHAFRIVYEDPHLLVVDKAAGVLTVPTEREEASALVHALSRYLSRGPRITRRAVLVHRLDRDTSGLLVFAKRREVADALKNQFRDRKPEREYLAILAGHLDRKRGTIEGYLATDPRLNQYTTPHAERGKLAITHFEVLQEVQRASLVRVRLETGRRNQIRVHFAERGHPVLGDVRYEPERATHPRWTWRRLALHACVLGFTHPETGRTLRFESPQPEEFARFLGSARDLPEAEEPTAPGTGTGHHAPPARAGRGRPGHAPRPERHTQADHSAQTRSTAQPQGTAQSHRTAPPRGTAQPHGTAQPQGTAQPERPPRRAPRARRERSLHRR